MEHDSSCPSVVGDTVTGRVRQHAPFGVFVDIGCGEVALLEVADFEPWRFERIRSQKTEVLFDGFPALGSEITATVKYAGKDGGIRLTQTITSTHR